MPLPSSSNFDEDVVERRITDPLANSLLVVGALCLVGAISVQIYEVFQYRIPGQDSVLGIASVHTASLERRLERTINEFQSVKKKAEALAPSKTPGEEPFLSTEAEEMARELLDLYGYGTQALHPVLKERGPTPESSAVKPPAGGETAEVPAASELESLLGGEEKPSGGEKSTPAGKEAKKASGEAEKSSGGAEEGGLDLDLQELEKELR